MKRLAINFFGGPGIGKTVASADLFSSLKKHNIECEMPSEFARDCVIEGNAIALKDQVFILGNQYHKVLSAYNKVPVTIVDSPILLCAIYGEHAGFPQSFRQLIIDLHNQFENINVLLSRSVDYQHSMAGRAHSLPESIEVDREIQGLMDDAEIPYALQSEIEASGSPLVASLTADILDYLNEEPTI